MQTKGFNKFIVIEGISGSGKTTISKMLAEQMSARYYTTPSVLFQKVRRKADRTLSLESRFLFYLSSVAHASWEISQILETQSVICDKYVWTTICYHKAYGLNIDIPPSESYLQPNHTFLLFCEEMKRLKRLRGRGPISDMEKYNLRQETERRCLVEFRQYINQEIDNSSNNPQHTANQIISIIKRE